MVNYDKVVIPDNQMTMSAEASGVLFFFEKWEAQNLKQYLFILVATAILCLIYEASSFYLSRMESEYIDCAKSKCHGKPPMQKKMMMVCLNFIKQTLGYALMLLIMSFNFGLIMTLILSRVVCNFAFGIVGDFLKIKESNS